MLICEALLLCSDCTDLRSIESEAARGIGKGGGESSDSASFFLPFRLRVNIPEFSSSYGREGFSLRLSRGKLDPLLGWLNTGHFSVSGPILKVKMIKEMIRPFNYSLPMLT